MEHCLATFAVHSCSKTLIRSAWTPPNAAASTTITPAADRLGDLPDYLLINVLSRLGSRQAVQTSLLSRRWRHLWRDVRCADIDDREFAEADGRLWERFEDFADHMLPPSPPPKAPHLDAFRLHVSSIGDRCRYAVSDRWIRRGLRRSPAAVAIHASDTAVARWITPPQPSSTLRRLATLRLVRVAVGAEDGFFERLGSLCPVLQELHVEDCRTDGSLRGIDSPTLVRLAVIGPLGRVSPADLIRAAPRLAFLRLDIPSDGLFGVPQTLDPPPPPLASVAEASIRITHAWGFDWELWTRNKKLESLSSVRGLLARLPNAATLHLSGFNPTALLDNATHEFLTLQSLRSLVLDNCDVGARYHALTSILRNAPNLEKLKLHHSKFVELLPLPVLRRHGATGALRCEKLESIEMKSSSDDDASRLLGELSKRMTPAQCQRIRKSNMVAMYSLRFKI